MLDESHTLTLTVDVQNSQHMATLNIRTQLIVICNINWIYKILKLNGFVTMTLL